MKKASAQSATERKLIKAAEKALTGENLETDMGNAAKPISLHPLKFEDAVSALLKVKPPAKPKA